MVLKEAFHENVKKVAEWVDEHGRLPRRLGSSTPTAQREERKEETRLASFLSREQKWISGSAPSKRDQPYPEVRRSELQAVPLLAERLHNWEKMREKLEVARASKATPEPVSGPPGEEPAHASSTGLFRLRHLALKARFTQRILRCRREIRVRWDASEPPA